MRSDKVEKILKNTITKLINYVHELEDIEDIENIKPEKNKTDYEELLAKYRYTANELFKAREEIALLKKNKEEN